MDPDTVEKTEACFFPCLTNHKVGMWKSIDASKSAGEGKKKIGAISKKTASPSSSTTSTSTTSTTICF